MSTLIREHGEDGGVACGPAVPISSEFLDDIAEPRAKEQIAHLRKALLIFHSPTDETVGIDNATAIFVAAKHPKSFVSLAGADHLLSRREDAAYVANVIARLGRTLSRHADADGDLETDAEGVTVTETGQGKFQQSITRRTSYAGGGRAGSRREGSIPGPTPYDLVLAGLGACTSMTLRLYADHKGLPLERVSVSLKHSRIHAADCETCETKEGQGRPDRPRPDADRKSRCSSSAKRCWKSPTNARFTVR